MPKISEGPKIKPFWATTDNKTVRLYLGDVIGVLQKLPAKSVQCCVTSPPYWGLRDYGTGTWEGGDADCPHEVKLTSDKSRLKPSEHNPVAGWTTRDATIRLNQGHRSKPVHKDGFKSPFLGTATGGSPYLEQGGMTSGKIANRNCPLGCGAVCADRQLGSEKTPQEFVAKMVEVFREVRRVLRDDGTLWLNLGDSYGPTGLVGAPWRVALALQEDGWVLRQDIIWAKPSPMPESVRNRCTKAHEYVFLLTKSNKYFCDMEAIKEKSIGDGIGTPSKKYQTETALMGASASGNQGNGRPFGSTNSNKRSVWKIDEDELEQFRVWKYAQDNKLDVWNTSSQGYAGAHFATFPPKLIEPMIKAGTSEKGCCVRCRAPWRRVVEEKQVGRLRSNGQATDEVRDGKKGGSAAGSVETKTVGWEPTCECGTEEVVPCTVLDPFIGSGTSCVVSLALGRRSVGIDLSEKYLLKNAIPRIEGALMARPALSGLVPRETKAVDLGEKAKTVKL